MKNALLALVIWSVFIAAPVYLGWYFYPYFFITLSLLSGYLFVYAVCCEWRNFQ
jgi:hypothetical protein